MKRDSAVDVMKGIAICMVILVHSKQKFKGLSPILDFLMFGQMGCQIFFVISGYLAEKSLLRNTDSKRFWKKRYMSIAPGYCLMIIVWLVLNWILGGNLGFASNGSLLSIVCNILFLNGLLPFCNNDVTAGGWYIGTTAVFYAIAPFLHYAMKESKKGKRLLMISFSASIGVPYILWCITGNESIIQNNGFVYFNAIVQLPCFLLGMRLHIEDENRQTNKQANMIRGAIFLGISMILFFVDIFSYRYIIMVSTMGISAYYLFQYCMQMHISNKVLERMGEMSFYMFLTHPFFAWTVPKYMMQIFGIRQTLIVTIIYIVMLPLIFAGTYLTACVLEKICKECSEQRGRELFDRVS